MLTRRRLLALAPVAAAGVWLSRPARARTSTGVAVANVALGAIVAAEGRDLVVVSIDASLSGREIRIGDAAPVDVAAKLRLKGSGAARERFLDDARNATRVGSAVRDALVGARPEDRARLHENHTAWARPFARKALAWTRALESSGLRERRVRDDHGRIYLLEWAGAIVDPHGTPSPGRLAHAPGAPDRPEMAGYEAYVQSLVDALGG
jgi:hypothetical protein